MIAYIDLYALNTLHRTRKTSASRKPTEYCIPKQCYFLVFLQTCQLCQIIELQRIDRLELRSPANHPLMAHTKNLSFETAHRKIVHNPAKEWIKTLLTAQKEQLSFERTVINVIIWVISPVRLLKQDSFCSKACQHITELEGDRLQLPKMSKSPKQTS